MAALTTMGKKVVNKILKVWIERGGVLLDKDSNFRINSHTSGYIKIINSTSKSIRVGVDKMVSLEEYQKGYIGKYRNELKTWIRRFLQQYSITNNQIFVIDPLSFRTNEENLYKEFEEFCNKNKLEPLLKPGGISTTIIYDELNSVNIEDSLKYNDRIDEYVTSAIDWYSAGLLQTKTTNQFLHYFIPLEILAGRFITDSGRNWKSENKKEHKTIEVFLKRVLEKKDPNKLSGLILTLSELSFIDKIKRYFKSIFTDEEIKNFWQDDTDITFNGKWIWKQYRLMSQYKRNKDRVDLFNVLKNLHQKRNDIVHRGVENVTSEDIFIIENILRRVLRKEIDKTKVSKD